MGKASYTYVFYVWHDNSTPQCKLLGCCVGGLDAKCGKDGGFS